MIYFSWLISKQESFAENANSNGILLHSICVTEIIENGINCETSQCRTFSYGYKFILSNIVQYSMVSGMILTLFLLSIGFLKYQSLCVWVTTPSNSFQHLQNRMFPNCNDDSILNVCKSFISNRWNSIQDSFPTNHLCIQYSYWMYLALNVCF